WRSSALASSGWASPKRRSPRCLAATSLPASPDHTWIISQTRNERRADMDHYFVFIGVTTGQSAIMQVFPAWAEYLRLQNVRLEGCDIPIGAPPERYRDVVQRMKADPAYLGALVTTHKIDLYNACRDLFDYIDPY